MADQAMPNSRYTAYTALLNELCARLGYCGCIKNGNPLHVNDFIPETGVVTADQFAEWVVLADNRNPSENPHLPDIQRAFVRHMGADAVDADLFR